MVNLRFSFYYPYKYLLKIPFAFTAWLRYIESR